jgi:hypothetical protein
MTIRASVNIRYRGVPSVSKFNRREALAYAICAAISVAVFGVNAKIEQMGQGAACALIHPIDKSAELDCRVAAVDTN